MVRKIYIAIFVVPVLSLASAIGMQGLLIPQSASILSTTGAGIAGNIDPSLNPALEKITHPSLQFSLNRWLGEMKGSRSVYYWGDKYPQHFSIQSWGAEDLELWDKNPDNSPLGRFGVHLVSAAYSLSHHFNTPYRFGFKIQTHYSHLFTSNLTGLSFDFGSLVPLAENIKIGAVLQNVGVSFKNSEKADFPLTAGLGVGINLPIIKSTLLADFLNVNSENEYRIGITTQWKWINFKAGRTLSENKNANALGFSFNYRRWQVHYGIYLHENSPVLGTPIFLDVRRYL
jgi:hypothetical protein